MLYLSYEEPDIRDNVVLDHRMVCISQDSDDYEEPSCHCGEDCPLCWCCSMQECECTCDDSCEELRSLLDD